MRRARRADTNESTAFVWMVGHSGSRSRAAQDAVSLVYGPASRPTMLCIERASYQSRLHSRLFPAVLPIPTGDGAKASFVKHGRSIFMQTQRLERDGGRNIREGVRNTIQSQSDASCLIKTYSTSSRDSPDITPSGKE